MSDFVIKSGKLVQYIGLGGRIDIPVGVTEICSKAFAGNSKILSVSMPKGVEKIADEAFMNCDSLSEVVLSDGLVEIGEKAFYGCVRLRTITFPKTLRIIRSCAFKGCRALANHNGFIIVGNMLCDYVGRDTDVVIPSGVALISGAAFAKNHVIQKVTIPDGVTKIDANAFLGCSQLKWVILPDTIKIIGDCAFKDCKVLQKIDMPDSVTVVGAEIFSNCTSLRSVKLSKRMTTITDNMFYRCNALQAVTLPDNVISIRNEAFGQCTNLQSLKLSTNIQVIEDYAFQGCQGLADAEGFVIVNGILFEYNGTNTTVAIPDGVIRIGASAFEDSTVENVTIPSSVTTIGMLAFKDCHELKEIIIPPTVTVIESGAFFHCPALAGANHFIIVRKVLYGYEGGSFDPVVPNGVKVISYGAFDPYYEIDSVTIPDSVEYIDENIFLESDKDVEVIFRGKNAFIHKYAFSNPAFIHVQAPAGGTIEQTIVGMGIDFDPV